MYRQGSERGGLVDTDGQCDAPAGSFSAPRRFEHLPLPRSSVDDDCRAPSSSAETADFAEPVLRLRNSSLQAAGMRLLRLALVCSVPDSPLRAPPRVAMMCAPSPAAGDEGPPPGPAARTPQQEAIAEIVRQEMGGLSLQSEDEQEQALPRLLSRVQQRASAELPRLGYELPRSGGREETKDEPGEGTAAESAAVEMPLVLDATRGEVKRLLENEWSASDLSLLLRVAVFLGAGESFLSGPAPSLYLPCTFPVPSLYLPCTFLGAGESFLSGPAPRHLSPTT